MVRKCCLVAAFAGAFVLGGCSREPRVFSSTVDVVTVRYWGDASEAAEVAAREECAKYGRRARFRTANSWSTGEQDAIFDCIV
ncbi:MAG TPA: hypothetical protein VLG66_05560 [Alphaproteobacteria bacterium]|nr:hypothetical protein [Alphaproteobacteria bacterium]